MITPLGSSSVPSPANPGDEASDLALLAGYGRDLAAAIDGALVGWVERCVVQRANAWRPGLALELAAATRDAAAATRVAVGTRLGALLALDPDAQRENPLSVVRSAVSFPTGVLAEAGVAAVDRDEFDRRAFPDDPYALSPASFRDLGPACHEAGIVWGAAKAHVLLARRRAEGQR